MFCAVVNFSSVSELCIGDSVGVFPGHSVVTSSQYKHVASLLYCVLNCHQSLNNEQRQTSGKAIFPLFSPVGRHRSTDP